MSDAISVSLDEPDATRKKEREQRQAYQTSLHQVELLTDVCTMLHLNGTCEVLFG